MMMKNRQEFSPFTERAHHIATTGCHLRRLAIAHKHNDGVSIAIRVLLYIIAVLI